MDSKNITMPIVAVIIVTIMVKCDGKNIHPIKDCIINAMPP
mgnify:CR=1 FL=1|jgi:hypothetical protein